jgi:hypothetical protein
LAAGDGGCCAAGLEFVVFGVGAQSSVSNKLGLDCLFGCADGRGAEECRGRAWGCTGTGGVGVGVGVGVGGGRLVVALGTSPQSTKSAIGFWVCAGLCADLCVGVGVAVAGFCVVGTVGGLVFKLTLVFLVEEGVLGSPRRFAKRSCTC